MKQRLFLDSHAIIEYLQKLGTTQHFISKNECVTTQWVLAEVIYYLIRIERQDLIEEVTTAIEPLLVPVTSETLLKSMVFKHKHQKLSYADCIGYIWSCENRCFFVTGDKQFEKMENVCSLKMAAK